MVFAFEHEKGDVEDLFISDLFVDLFFFVFILPWRFNFSHFMDVTLNVFFIAVKKFSVLRVRTF